MPVREEDIAGSAHRLIAAEQRCVPIEPITFLYPNLTEDDAYRVQMAVVATRVEHGARVIGRKVGATSEPIRQLLQIDEPIYGTLRDSNQVANGEEVASATGAAVLGDPARAVAWLANKLAENHQRIKARAIVLPGSMTPIYPVGAGDRVAAEFEALGSVSVRFA
jgi:2-keto-4-pentenoate hydratase